MRQGDLTSRTRWRVGFAVPSQLHALFMDGIPSEHASSYTRYTIHDKHRAWPHRPPAPFAFAKISGKRNPLDHAMRSWFRGNKVGDPANRRGDANDGQYSSSERAVASSLAAGQSRRGGGFPDSLPNVGDSQYIGGTQRQPQDLSPARGSGGSRARSG